MVGRTVVVTNQGCDSRRRKANLTLNCGNARRINFSHWRINLKLCLPKYPTCVVTGRMDPKTLMRNAKRTVVSTMRNLMPLSGGTGSNSIYQNSKFACNPKSSWWQKKIPQKEVPRKMAKMVAKEGVEIKHQSVSRYVGGTCRQFQRTCILGGKEAKLVIDPMSGVNVVLEEVVRKLGLETKRHLNPYQLECLTTEN